MRNIFLIGPMGAGKSVIGKLLAKELSFNFYDSDKEIEKQTGVNIPWIFDLEGEEGFRCIEEKTIDALTRLSNVVLATGGGAVLSSKNRAALSARGIVIYLQVSIEKQLQRLKNDHGRPLLRSPNLYETLQSLKVKRDPFYRELADWIISTESHGIQFTANKILQKISHGNDHC